jgi:hypothetical protein
MGVAGSNEFVKVGIVASGSGDGAGVEDGGLLVEVCAIICGVDWATAAGGAVGVPPC